MCLSARHLSACLFHVSASGAIIAAATANSRRSSQQNPYKTRVSLVELGRTSRHFIVHFEKIPTKKFPRYGRCAARMLSIIHAEIEREDFGGDMTAFWWKDRQRASRAPVSGLAARVSVDLHRAEGKVRADEALVRPPLLNMWDEGHERYSRRATGSLSPTAHTPIIVSKARWYLRTGPAACQRSRRSWPSATEHDQHLRFFGCSTGRPRRSPAPAVSSGGTPWGFDRD